MYEWSKGLVKKIGDSGCLSWGEMRSVEVALRLREVLDDIMLEALGPRYPDDRFELTYVGGIEKQS